MPNIAFGSEQSSARRFASEELGGSRRFLHRVVRLTERAQHPVRDSLPVGPVRLEPRRELMPSMRTQLVAARTIAEARRPGLRAGVGRADVR